MKKLFTSSLLVLALLVMTTGNVFAQEATPVTGTVQSISLESDPTDGETNVVLTLLDTTTSATQTVKIRLATAEALGLVTTDPITGEPVATDTAVGINIEIDPTTIIVDETTEEEQHPVGSALADFFGDLLGVDYDTVMDFHEDGFGFGVIAQALWLTNNVDGDNTTFETLLEAKESGDYSSITLADGSTPDNWGDVVKSLKKGDKLGSVMSGKAEKNQDSSDAPDAESSSTTVHGNGNSNGNGNGNH